MENFSKPMSDIKFEIPLSDIKFKIETFDFDTLSLQKVDSKRDKGENWPVVYVIYDRPSKKQKRCIYIGETSNFAKRFQEHLSNSEKRKIFTKSKSAKISYLYEGYENKSVVLDYEANLIRLCSADKSLDVINKNSGQSTMHQYYAKDAFSLRMKTLWETLKKSQIVKGTYEQIVNDNLFKYSPFTALTTQQENVLIKVMDTILDKMNREKGSISIINGGAGTGKSLLAIKMINIFFEYKTILSDYEVASKEMTKEELAGKFDNKIIKICKSLGSLYTEKNSPKIGYIAPLQSLNKDNKKILERINKNLGGVALSAGSDQIVKFANSVNKNKINPLDVLIVDETHRLKHARTERGRKDCMRQRVILNFKTACQYLYPNEEWCKKNQLDVLLKCAKHVVLFYDKDQTVTTNDITHEEMMETIKKSRKNYSSSKNDYKLDTQLRCLGGKSFIDFINNLFDGTCEQKYANGGNSFKFKLFDDVDTMFDKIKCLNEKYGLCRMAAGYAWEWETKDKVEQKEPGKFSWNEKSLAKNSNQPCDIPIGKGYVWNIKDKGWVSSPNSVNEIGCIHTLQGVDLNYIGLIIGEDLTYDEDLRRIKAIPKNNKDTYEKKKENIDEKFIINTYKTLLFRGIHGCFIYVKDEKLRNYLREFIPTYKEYPSLGNNGRYLIAAESQAPYDASK